MSDEKSVSFQESLDVFVYMEALLNKLEEYKADDGKVSFGEWVKTFSSTAPEAVKAVVGSWNIGSDKFTNEELIELGSKAFVLVGKLAQIVVK